MQSARIIYLLTAATIAGCGTRIKGEIDGEKLDIVSAFFVQGEEVYSESGDGVIRVLASSTEDFCDVLVEFFEDMEDVRQAEEMVSIWADAFPEDWWTMEVVIRVNDPTDAEDVEKGEYEGVDWDGYVEADEEAHAVFTHFTDHQDAQFFAEGAEPDLDNYYSDDGDLTISSFQPEESLKGTFTTTAVDDQGDDEGEIEIKLNAIWCEDYQDLAYDDGHDGNTGGGPGE